ncbi:protein-glutamate O-methyltransferase CheR [bacterium]|nr:protein-glutamate O-methyltransferase CheR [bacterium]
MSNTTTTSGRTNKIAALSDDEFQLLRDFISKHFGIYYDDEKRWLLESRLSRLMEKETISSFFGYYQHLIQKFYCNQSFTDPEFVSLLGALANNETFFHREPTAFEALWKNVIPKFYDQGEREIRILSAACSSGEEPYSIAIQFEEKRKEFPGLKISVVGLDIDLMAIGLATKGIYADSAFRGISDLAIHDMYKKNFDYDKDLNQYRIRNAFKKEIIFIHGNLMNSEIMHSLGRFHVIFCRNVLIYFHDDCKRSVLQYFDDILNPGGALFLSSSDHLPHMDEFFDRMQYHGHPVYFKV